MSSETPIKPGDVVRWAGWTGEALEGVVAVIDLDRATVVHAEPRPIGPLNATSTEGRIDGLIYVRDATAGEYRAAVLHVCGFVHENDRYRQLARKEALARGWRELDREDVTEEVKLINALIGDVAIGCVEFSHPKRWTWMHWSPEFDVIGHGAGETKEEAQDQLIAAENARRAQEKDHA